MQYRVRGSCSNFLIDLDSGYLYMLYTTFTKKELVEKKSKWKKIKTLQDAYEYLSQTEGMPIWKLKSRTKDVFRKI